MLMNKPSDDLGDNPGETSGSNDRHRQMKNVQPYISKHSHRLPLKSVLGACSLAPIAFVSESLTSEGTPATNPDSAASNTYNVMK